MNLDIAAPAQQLLNTFISALPTMLTFVGVLIAGLILGPIAAKLARTLAERTGLEALLERIGAPKLLYRVGYKHSTAKLFGSIARMLIYLFTALIAADVAGMSQISRGLDAFIAYLPHLAVAIIFLMVGVWAADMVRSVVSNVAKRQQGQIIGTVLYYGVIAITVALVADQLGLETALINQIIVLIVAGAIFAAALGLGLSSRAVLSNLLARNYVAQLYPRGDSVRIGEIEGVVKGHSPTALVIVNDEKTYNIPYVHFMQDITTTSGKPRPIERAKTIPEEEVLQDAASEETP